MATIIEFKRKSNPTTDKEYFEYATHTGLCPKCGSELRIIYTCRGCGTVAIVCDCGFQMERRLP